MYLFFFILKFKNTSVSCKGGFSNDTSSPACTGVQAFDRSLPLSTEEITPGLQVLDFFYHFLLMETGNMQKVN